MRPTSLRFRNARSAVLALAGLAAVPASAEEAPARPTCRPTVPVPPPEPPARPEELTGVQQGRTPDAALPLPPQRPADLSSAAPTAQHAAPPSLPSLGDAPASKIDPAPGRPVPAPLPPERPPELSRAPPDAPQPPPSLDLPRCIPDLAAPLPPARPPELSPPPVPPEEAPLPPARPPELSGDGALKLTVAPQDDAECLRSLDSLGVAYVKAAPIVNGQCTVANPLTVSKLGDGIAIGSPETMVCRLAEGLTRWTAQVQQTAETELGDTLKGLTLGGTYVCRGQNHGAEAQLSEHAFANAVDVMGFTFGKRAPILVGPLPDGSKEAAFLAAVRTKACAHFTTVLGPGTDEQHANHLHLDERERKAGYRLCQ